MEYDLCEIPPPSASPLTCVCWIPLNNQWLWLDGGRRGSLEGLALGILETGVWAKTKGMG